METEIGLCVRCGNTALRDFRCVRCGAYGLFDVEEGGCLFDEKEGVLFEVPPDGGPKARVVCHCGCAVFKMASQELCGWCAYRDPMDKG